jgi:hypothetical protein
MAEFRCLGCGAVADLDVRDGILRLGDGKPNKPPPPTCSACDRASWVRCGSMTEYYLYSQRTTVCRIGDHVATETRAYVCYPRTQLAPRPGTVRLESITVNVCPEHVEQLHADGVLGFFPESAMPIG